MPNSNSTPTIGLSRFSRFESRAKSWHLVEGVSRCWMMKRQLSLGCPMFSPSNKDNCIKKNRKKILVKNRICLGQTAQDTIFVRIEDWGFISDFRTEIFFRFSIFFKCNVLENTNIRTFCWTTTPKFPRSKMLHPKPVGHDSERASAADRDRLLGTDQNRCHDFEISLMQCCR